MLLMNNKEKRFSQRPYRAEISPLNPSQGFTLGYYRRLPMGGTLLSALLSPHLELLHAGSLWRVNQDHSRTLLNLR
jgi:hypothetical protein